MSISHACPASAMAFLSLQAASGEGMFYIGLFGILCGYLKPSEYVRPGKGFALPRLSE